MKTRSYGILNIDQNESDLRFRMVKTMAHAFDWFLAKRHDDWIPDYPNEIWGLVFDLRLNDADHGRFMELARDCGLRICQPEPGDDHLWHIPTVNDGPLVDLV